MIQVTPQTRILLAVEPADFRKGIDGLARLCRDALSEDPFSGALIVFRNRRRTALKILYYDTQGFNLLYKRLSERTFKWWPASADLVSYEMAVHELQLLLWNGDPSKAGVAPAWRQVSRAPRFCVNSPGESPNSSRARGNRESALDGAG